MGSSFEKPKRSTYSGTEVLTSDDRNIQPCNNLANVVQKKIRVARRMKIIVFIFIISQPTIEVNISIANKSTFNSSEWEPMFIACNAFLLKVPRSAKVPRPPDRMTHNGQNP